MEVPFGPTGRVVYDRTYSRTLPDGSKETWPETVRRVARGNLALVYGDEESWDEKVHAEYDALVALMEVFAIIPAGRHLWASGVKGRQYLFNCHVSGWGMSLSDHFEFTFLRLMEGGGVGANYSSRFLAPFGAPRRELVVHIVCDPAHPDYAEMEAAGVLSHSFSHEWEGAFPVEDSREGWAAALVDLIDTYMTDDVVKHADRVYDVSRVRAKGQPLRTFGGTASGPQPFAKMMTDTGDVMNEAHVLGRLYPTAAMEIDHAIAECVVSGGVRRSARMAICHWADLDIINFIKCKQDTGKHWTTNISVEIDQEFLDELEAGNPHVVKLHKMVVEQMLTNGEPGYWNSTLSNVGEVNEIIATNPCFSPDTVVETERGPLRIADMTEPMMVYTKGPSGRIEMRKASASFVTKRNADTVTVTLSNGDSLTVTPDHLVMLRSGEYVEAGTLRRGDELETICRSRPRATGWKNTPKVVSVQVGPVTDVYDIVVDETHNLIANGVVAHNCGEIALPEWGACVLGHVNLDAFTGEDNGEALGLAHRLMARFLIRATYGDMNDPKQKHVMDTERRIGVGHLGVQSFLAKQGMRYSEAPHHPEFPHLLDTLKQIVRTEARHYAFELRIPEPVKVTTVAPTGSIAKLPGVSEGIHPIYARHFLRRVRFNVTDPAQRETVLQAWSDGFHVEEDIYDSSGNTMVVTYPTKDKLVAEVEELGLDPAIVESADELTVREMLSFQEMYQTHYADNAISMTVNVEPGKVTVEQLAHELSLFLPGLKGTTVMVDGTRPQAPYSRITQAEYEQYEAVRVEDGTDEDCQTGACPVR